MLLTSLPEKISRHISYEPNTGCWLWIGADDGHGYALLRRERKTRRAHRFIYELLVGPIPSGLDLDHLCRVRACVNPKHLEPVTRAVNLGRGEHRNGSEKRTTCPQGHIYDEVTKNGWRACATCRREKWRRWNRKRISRELDSRRVPNQV